MADSVAKRTIAQPKRLDGSQNPRRRFTSSQRDPLQLPGEKIELPTPPPSPGPPPTINLLTTILPPALMIAVSLIVSLVSGQANWVMIFSAMGMSVGFPVANLVGLSSQKKKYKQSVEDREKSYCQRLKEERHKLDLLVSRQISLLEESYPSLLDLERLVLSGSKLMWAQRPTDDDFLDLRFGLNDGPPSFTIEPLRSYDQTDKLPQLAEKVVQDYQKVKNLPTRLCLSKLGSVAISGRSPHVYGVTRRLMLDLVIHHSPQDVQVAVFGDTREAVENWEWLKWIPHTDSLNTDTRNYRLAFDSLAVDKLLESLMREYNLRRGQPESGSASKGKTGEQPAIVVLLDDSGRVRQHEDICTLAEWGYEARIYLLFVGGRD